MSLKNIQVRKASFIARSVSDEAIQSCFVAFWIASRSLSSGGNSPDPLARNDGDRTVAALRLDNLLALFAETFNAERDDVADVEEFRRLHAGADAGRRPRGDDVAGQQGHELRDIGNA